MSVPFGAPRQPGPAGSGDPSPIARLPLVAAGAGLLAYLLAYFTAQSAAAFAGIPGFCLITAAALAGMRSLPKAPNTLYAAGPLAAAGALVLLQVVLRGGAETMLIIIMVLALIQLAAVTGALLWEAGVVGAASGAKPRPMPPPSNPSHFPPPPGGWSPPPGGPGQPGPFSSSGGRSPAGPAQQPQPQQAQPQQSQQPYPQQPQFPPSGPQQGGWVPARQDGGATQQIPPPPPGGSGGPLSPPGGQPAEPPPSGGFASPPSSGAPPRGTQYLQFPPDES